MNVCLMSGDPSRHTANDWTPVTHPVTWPYQLHIYICIHIQTVFCRLCIQMDIYAWVCICVLCHNRVNNYMIKHHFLPIIRAIQSHHYCKIIWINVTSCTKLNSYVNMLTIPINHDHVITQNVNKDLLILKCTCYIKTLTYHLQVADICINCKIYTITGHDHSV